jgi:hypothetical protein
MNRTGSETDAINGDTRAVPNIVENRAGPHTQGSKFSAVRHYDNLADFFNDSREHSL